MQSPTNERRRWTVRYYYMFAIIAGLMIYFSASPISSLFQLNDEEYAKMDEYTLSTGLPYKGKDFLEWRYGWVGVYFWVSVTGFAIVLAGTILGVRRLWIDSGVEQRKQLADIFKPKHARAET